MLWWTKFASEIRCNWRLTRGYVSGLKTPIPDQRPS